MIRALVLAVLLAGPALAEAPEASLVPKPRPASETATEVPVPTTGVTAPRVSLVPKARPGDLVASAEVEPTTDAAVPPPKSKKTKKGKGLCNDPRLAGERLESFGSAKGCGITEPVRLREVLGISLSTAATVDCTTASALADWVEKVAEPGFRKTGGGLSQLYVMASYACRPRNNQKGNRLSEHGKGHAIDIGGFVLNNGKTVTVLGDWGKGKAGKILKTLRQGACGIFDTVLGPGSDAFHRNHFHFDTARYRKGSYCS